MNNKYSRTKPLHEEKIWESLWKKDKAELELDKIDIQSDLDFSDRFKRKVIVYLEKD